MRHAIIICLVSVSCLETVTHSSAVIYVHAEASFRDVHATEWQLRLLSDDRAVKRAAVRDLAAGGEDALPVVIELLRRADEHSGPVVEDVLSRIGVAALEAVVDALDSPGAYSRYHAISVLRNLGADAAPAIARIAERLFDENAAVAMESARALAVIGEAAHPATRMLASALAHEHRTVRATAAGALASIGPRAAAATEALVAALRDPEISVRRCAADAIAAIGPVAAESAVTVPALIERLDDESLFVRVSASGALGALGAAAKSAAARLEAALADPAMRSEVAWALERITGERPELAADPAIGSASTPTVAVSPPPKPGEWAMFGGSASRNAIAPQGAELPLRWDTETRENLRWSARLGRETYGTPVVAGGVVYIGSGNEAPRDIAVQGPMGILMAFDASDGAFLWQDASPPLGRGLDSFLLPQTTSSPFVEGERLYYVTAQALVRCLDTRGFLDGENDGPVAGEWRAGPRDADIVWELDLSQALGVFPHEAPNCSIAAAGDLLMICTSNGVDEAHTNVPAPRAPSFIAVDKRDGRVVWQVVGPGENVLHGQWSSPAIAELNGRPLAFFGGGDGWLYALEAASGAEVWRYDGNPKDAIWRMSSDIEGMVFRNNIIANPVVAGGRVYLALGQDPNHGHGKGRIHAIDPGGRGDVTTSRRVWENDRIGRTIATPVVHDGLLYAADYNGFVHAIDITNGATVWSHDLLAGVWSALLVSGDRLYVGDEGGTVTVFRSGRKKEILARSELDAAIWGGFAVAGDVLYVATSTTLYAIGASR